VQAGDNAPTGDERLGDRKRARVPERRSVRFNDETRHQLAYLAEIHGCLKTTGDGVDADVPELIRIIAGHQYRHMCHLLGDRRAHCPTCGRPGAGATG
jgi:hypothetical protein